MSAPSQLTADTAGTARAWLPTSPTHCFPPSSPCSAHRSSANPRAASGAPKGPPAAHLCSEGGQPHADASRSGCHRPGVKARTQHGGRPDGEARWAARIARQRQSRAHACASAGKDHCFACSCMGGGRSPRPAPTKSELGLRPCRRVWRPIAQATRLNGARHQEPAHIADQAVPAALATACDARAPTEAGCPRDGWRRRMAMPRALGLIRTTSLSRATTQIDVQPKPQGTCPTVPWPTRCKTNHGSVLARK